MKNNTKLKFTIDQLTEFFKKYPIHGLKDMNFIKHDETDIYLLAFKYYIEHGVDIMEEYYRIKDAVIYCYNINDYRSMYIHEDYSYNNHLVKIVEELKFVINYNGAWNIEQILNLLGSSREKIQACIYEIENDFPKYFEKIEMKRKEDQEEYVKKYYEVQRILTKEDLDLFFDKTIHEQISHKIDKNIVDVTAIKYPILVFFYKDNLLIAIRKIVKNLEASMVNYKKSIDFDNYSYIYISEDIIDDTQAEALVRYNPIDMASNSINIKNSMYRTLGQIKKRYKGDARVDLRVIKNVISIYHIPLYTLINGQQIVDKDLFDEALGKYISGK